MKPSMRRIGLVAGREFMAAVTNKGFVIGLLLMPAHHCADGGRVPACASASGCRRFVAKSRSSITRVRLPERLRAALAPEAITRAAAREHEARAREHAGRGPRRRKQLDGDGRTVGTPPELTILDRPATADLPQEKQWLMAPPSPGGLRHLALIVVQPDAVVPADGRTRLRRLRAVRAREPRRAHRDGVVRRAQGIAGRGEDSCAQPRSRAGGSRHAGPAGHLGDRGRRHGAADERRLQPHAAVRVRRAPGVRRDDWRPDTADADRGGEVQPRDRSPALGGVADRADGGEDPGPDGGEHAGARALHRHGDSSC